MKVMLGVLLLALAGLAFMAVRSSSNARIEADARAKAERELQTARGELERLTQDGNPRIRQKAIELLQECRPEQAAGLCPRLLENEKDPGVVMALLDIAGTQRIKQAFPSVLRHLKDGSDLPIRAKAAWAIGELAEVLDQAQREESRKALVQTVDLKAKDPSPTTPGHPAVQGKTEIGLSLASVDALGRLKDPQSAAALIALLRPETSIIVRRAVVRCLAGIVGKDQTDALQAAWRQERDAMLRGDIERLLGQEPFNLALDHGKGGFIPKAPKPEAPAK